jgi:hypothetical protein
MPQFSYQSSPEWPLPLVERYCAIFETVGDRRLGDHLLVGIERLLPLLYCDPSEQLVSSLSNAIASGRGVELSSSDDLWDTSMVVECGMQVASGLSTFPLKENPLPSYMELQSAGISVPLCIAHVWDKANQKLSMYLNAIHNEDDSGPIPVGQSVVLFLATRLGLECGQVLRALQNMGVCWGTYPDKLGIHCNAHVNNMVVCPPVVPASSPEHQLPRFLAPLDFDMAFDRAGFLPEAISGAVQKLFPCDWEGIMRWERDMGFRPSLAGSNFARYSFMLTLSFKLSRKKNKTNMTISVFTRWEQSQYLMLDYSPFWLSACTALEYPTARQSHKM